MKLLLLLIKFLLLRIQTQILSKGYENLDGLKREVHTLRKLIFHFLSYGMGYDHDDSFPFDFEPNGIPFGSENRKENCHHDHIPFNLKGNGNIVFSEYKTRQETAEQLWANRLVCFGFLAPIIS